jgi:hypothetical protein
VTYSNFVFSRKAFIIMQTIEYTELELTDDQLQDISGACQGTTLGVVQLGGGLHLGGGFGFGSYGYGYGFGTPVVVEQQPTLTVVQQPPTVVVPQCQPQLVGLPTGGVQGCQTATLTLL